MSDTTTGPGARNVTNPDTRAKGRGLDITLRVVQVLMALFFLASGIPKVIGHSSAAEIFDRIGFGDWFMYSIGVLEIAGAVALLVPLLAGLAGLAFIGLMIGAFTTTVVALDGENAATPLIVIVPAAAIAWGRRRSTAELLRRVRGPA